MIKSSLGAGLTVIAPDCGPDEIIRGVVSGPDDLLAVLDPDVILLLGCFESDGILKASGNIWDGSEAFDSNGLRVGDRLRG